MSRLKSVLTIFTFVLCIFTSGAQEPSKPENVLISVSGIVQVAEGGKNTWKQALHNQTLKVGDRVRTGKNSKAAIRLASTSVLRLQESTTMEIPGQKSDSR
jgi:hypothetical protein